MLRTQPTAASRLTWKVIFAFAGLAAFGGLVGAVRGSDTQTASATLSVAQSAGAELHDAAVETTAAAPPTDYDMMVAEEAPSKQTLLASLKDGKSARIKDVTGVKVDLDGTTVYAFCGMVNAKNSYGAYGGYERFIAGPSIAGTSETIEGFEPVWEKMCSEGKVIMHDVPFQLHLLG